MKCRFCKRPALAPCSWPTEKPTLIPHADLTMEHTLAGLRNKARRPLTVVRFRAIHAIGRSTHWSLVTMFAIDYNRDRYWLFYKWGRDRVRVFAPATCEAPCCENHFRDVGDGAGYCRDHWDAWQFVGGSQ